ncbi:inorganic diphosphatase [Pelotalea chapellei]|uniref:inorganic diphosphatase n=1 Tax=Pelotalea chapellei TaxID=44671 RepID=A0ABS5U617_9BACT|nr:inorganic diphosphatase [Pelotalea chapellei]MBT1071103.1 inorganic diphosphatase [Pelotalea chapellei]
MTSGPTSNPFAGLGPFDRISGGINTVIETPKGSRNKYKYEEDPGIFRLSGVLPLGAAFPFDFGFLPGTVGGDGDPLDVLLLMDEAVFPGCLVPARLVGVIEAEQVEEGQAEQNDRLIAVASASRTHGDVHSLADLNGRLLEEIEHFFISYNHITQKIFRPLGRNGPERARLVVEEGIKRFSGR